MTTAHIHKSLLSSQQTHRTIRPFHFSPALLTRQRTDQKSEHQRWDMYNTSLKEGSRSSADSTQGLILLALSS